MNDSKIKDEFASDYSVTITYPELLSNVEPIITKLTEWRDEEKSKLLHEWNIAYENLLARIKTDDKFVWQMIQTLGYANSAKTFSPEYSNWQRSSGFKKLFMPKPDDTQTISARTKNELLKKHEQDVLKFISEFKTPPHINMFHNKPTFNTMRTIMYPSLPKYWQLEWRDVDIIENEVLRPLNNMMKRYKDLFDEYPTIQCIVGSNILGIMSTAREQIKYVECRKNET